MQHQASILRPTICMLSAQSSISESNWQAFLGSCLAWYSRKKCIMDSAELSASSPQWLYRQKTDSYPYSFMNFLQPSPERLSMIWSVWNQVQSRTSKLLIVPWTSLRGWLSLCGQRMQVLSSGLGNLLKTCFSFQASFSPSLLVKGQKATWLVRKRMGATELLLIFSERWWMMCSWRGSGRGGRVSSGHFWLHLRQQNFIFLLQLHVNFSFVSCKLRSSWWLMCSRVMNSPDFSDRLLKVQFICPRRRAEGSFGLLITFLTYFSFSIFLCLLLQDSSFPSPPELSSRSTSSPSFFLRKS